MTETAAQCIESIDTPLTASVPSATIGSQPACAYCRAPFVPRKPWQRYCTTACRSEAYSRDVAAGIDLKVSSVRVLKRGELSVVVRIAPIHRHQFDDLAPGQLLKVVRP